MCLCDVRGGGDTGNLIGPVSWKMLWCEGDEASLSESASEGEGDC